jgi:hypothetical protein
MCGVWCDQNPNKSQLPLGVSAVRPHLRNVDNVCVVCINPYSAYSSVAHNGFVWCCRFLFW